MLKMRFTLELERQASSASSVQSPSFPSPSSHDPGVRLLVLVFLIVISTSWFTGDVSLLNGLAHALIGVLPIVIRRK